MMITDEILEEYLDGTLPPEKRAVFEARLAIDANLRDRISFMRSVDQHTATSLQRRAPSSLTESVMGSIQLQGHVSDKQSKSAKWPLYAFLGLLIVFSLAGYILPGTGNAIQIPNISPLPDILAWLTSITAIAREHLQIPALSSQGSIFAAVGALLFLLLIDLFVLRPRLYKG